MINSKRRGHTPSQELVAGNGLINRRALLGHGIAIAGAMSTAGTMTGAAAEPLKDDPQWSLEFGSTMPPVQIASPYEKDVVRSLSNPNGRIPQLARAHAAPSARRYRHAERPALLYRSLRRAEHRPGPAQARDPRHGAPAAGIHAGDAVALPARHPHDFLGMRRQFGADVLQRAAAGDGAGDPRPRLQRRMDRRAAVDPARRSRHRSERQMADRRGRGRALP